MLSKYVVETENVSKEEYEKNVRNMTPNADGSIAGANKKNSDDISTARSTASTAGTNFSISTWFASKPTVKPIGKKGSKKNEDIDESDLGKVASAVLEHKDAMEELTLHDFIKELGYLTRNAKSTYNCLHEVKWALEYTNDPSANTLGLSRIGGYIWLLTYSIQHLVNPMCKPVNLLEQLAKTQEGYQEIAAKTHKMGHTVKHMDEVLQHYRECAAWIVKRTEKLFAFEDSAFRLKPEFPAKVHRASSFGKRVGFTFDDANIEEENDGLFHVQWSPLTILVKLTPEGSWDTFASYGITEKLGIVETFLQEAINYVDMSIEKVSKSTEFLTMKNVNYDTNVITMKSEITAMIYPVVHFLGKTMELPPERDLLLIKSRLRDFWITVDAMHVVGHEVMRLVQESRDIVRTCYVYATQFYHWRLTDYDTFEPISSPRGRRPTKTTLFFAKILGNRRVSDNLLFLSLADFTSSIYQYIVQENELIAGGMNMMLEAFEEEEQETWGLIPGAFEHIKKPKHMVYGHGRESPKKQVQGMESPNNKVFPNSSNKSADSRKKVGHHRN